MINENMAFLVKQTDARYPEQLPFHPAEAYPEYPHAPDRVSPGNDAYVMIRNLLRDMSLDAHHYGTPEWNPLGDLVKPGGRVLVKPNIVLDEHPRGGDLACLITHGSLVRAVLDYVWIALKGKGSVVVGDAPIQGTNFARAVERSGIRAVVDFFAAETSLPILLVDFRRVIGIRDKHHHTREWKDVPGDPNGYMEYDLAMDSVLAPIGDDSDKFRVSQYRVEETLRYHNKRSHKYVVTGSLIKADLVINIPKLKTHCKAGVTLGLKNFVGTIGFKQCLAHHREQGPGKGGDEYPDDSKLKRLSVILEERISGNPHILSREAMIFFQRVVWKLMKWLGVNPLRDGGWYGNDTVWRMVHDLVRIACYGTPQGVLAPDPQRPILTILDGILAGENEGPLEATPVHANCLVGGMNPAVIDVLAATLMGFDYRKIPLLKNLWSIEHWPLLQSEPGELRLRTGSHDLSLKDIAASSERMTFKPPQGWIGHVEL